MLIKREGSMESITINYIYNSNVQEEKKDDDILIHK